MKISRVPCQNGSTLRKSRKELGTPFDIYRKKLEESTLSIDLFWPRKVQLDQLLREWLSDLKDPLLPALTDDDKLSDVQLNTAKMVYSILEDLNMSQGFLSVVLKILTSS